VREVGIRQDITVKDPEIALRANPKPVCQQGSCTTEQGSLLGDVQPDALAMILEIALYAVRVRMCIYKDFIDTVPAAELEPNPQNGYALNRKQTLGDGVSQRA